MGDDFIAAFRPALDQAGNETGTLLYVLQRSRDNPDLFWVSELYADEATFAAHRDSAAMAAAPPALASLIAESEVIIGEPVAGKGIPI
jgi:quinol monooxygenase YgiN